MPWKKSIRVRWHWDERPNPPSSREVAARFFSTAGTVLAGIVLIWLLFHYGQ